MFASNYNYISILNFLILIKLLETNKLHSLINFFIFIGYFDHLLYCKFRLSVGKLKSVLNPFSALTDTNFENDINHQGKLFFFHCRIASTLHCQCFIQQTHCYRKCIKPKEDLRVFIMSNLM